VPLVAVSANLSPWLVRPDVPRQVAAVIHGDPGATAWVVNSEPIIYFLAAIDAPTRFPFPPHLVGTASPLIGIDPVAEVERILARHPRFLVLEEGRWDEVSPQTSALVRTALARDYVKVASFPAKPPNVDVFRLDPAALPPAAAGR
jgi:hypothetical protein